MALQTRVLVSSINNLSDARYCAGMGADMIGFDLDATSEEYIEPTTFKAITSWISGVHFVGELTNAEAKQAQELLKDYLLDYLQVEHTTDWPALADLGIPIICKVHVRNTFTYQIFNQTYGPIRQYIKWFILDSDTEELSPSKLNIINQIAADFPVLLGFGINVDTIKDLLSLTAIQGIVLKGSHEIRPGFKDFDDLAHILEAIEIEE